jgi:hypothetical protein
MRSLESILELLQRHRQRATYGAVAALVRRTPQNVMQGCPRDWLHSWVVNQGTGLPSEYPAGKIHPALKERAEIISSEQELATWLQQKSQEGEPA